MSDMSRTLLISVLVFAAGVLSGWSARRVAGVLQPKAHAADLAAIKRLNQEDIEATLAQDPKRLIDLWAEEAVAFYPGSPPAVGRQAIAAHNGRLHAQYPALKVLRYISRYKDVHIEGGVASEWFEKDAEYRLSPQASPISWHATGLIVLKRQSDGSWKAVMVWPE